MEESIYIDGHLPKKLSQADEELNGQFFFYAQEPKSVPRAVPSEFIMQRMLRVE